MVRLRKLPDAQVAAWAARSRVADSGGAGGKVALLPVYGGGWFAVGSPTGPAWLSVLENQAGRFRLRLGLARLQLWPC